MPLVKCAACHAEVSGDAAACPKCGHPMKATPAGGINFSDPVHVIGVLIAGLIVAGILVAFVVALVQRNTLPL